MKIHSESDLSEKILKASIERATDFAKAYALEMDQRLALVQQFPKPLYDPRLAFRRGELFACLDGCVLAFRSSVQQILQPELKTTECEQLVAQFLKQNTRCFFQLANPYTQRVYCEDGQIPFEPKRVMTLNVHANHAVPQFPKLFTFAYTALQTMSASSLADETFRGATVRYNLQSKDVSLNLLADFDAVCEIEDLASIVAYMRKHPVIAVPWFLETKQADMHSPCFGFRELREDRLDWSFISDDYTEIVSWQQAFANREHIVDQYDGVLEPRFFLIVKSLDNISDRDTDDSNVLVGTPDLFSKRLKDYIEAEFG